MPILIVENGYSVILPGLGTRTRFEHLSEKRVTKAVRAALTRQFGSISVEVSCEAEFTGDSWRGNCLVFGRAWPYHVFP